MDALVPFLAVVLVLVLALTAFARLVGIVTVHEYERGLRFDRGRLRGLVPAGTHAFIRPLSEIRLLDGRPTTLLVEGQEVMTADGVAVKVTVAARYVVGDPVAATLGDADFQRAMYLMLQLSLRDALAARTLDEALAQRREIGQAILQASASDLALLGVELLAVEVRDLMLPGELKRAFAAVIAARKDGEAALERARSETAALRSLANAGRMVADNPGLLQLRMLQQVGGGSGNTVMLGMPDGAGPPTAAAASTAARVRSRRAAGSTLPVETEPDGESR